MLCLSTTVRAADFMPLCPFLERLIEPSVSFGTSLYIA
ncbi:hypothetical protein D918_01965 [Trichuris suis]|nr:hypothetical protein D918_01965 [Trichuris suis]